MYTLKNPFNGATFLRIYKTVTEAAKDAMSIFNDTGILFLIVEVK